jgi:hypothetical protein
VSPILGIYASQNYARNPLTGFVSIATVTVGSGGQASAEFTSIPSVYKHLQIRITGRSTLTGNRTATLLQFNGDTTSNYRWHGLGGSGASASGEESGSLVSAIRLGSSNIPMSDAGSNIFGVSVADILDYTNTNKNKVTRSLAGQDQNNTNGRINLVSGLWLNTASVTSIKVIAEGASWAEYSSIALYGIQGA